MNDEQEHPPDEEAPRPVFFLHLGSPWCWLAAERVNHALGQVPVWEPVRAGVLPDDPPAPSAWAPGETEEVTRRATEGGLLRPSFPGAPPADLEMAMRTAAFAQASGRIVAFSLAALRQAFAAGRDLSVPDHVLVAAAACELHPRAVLKGVESRTVTARLDASTARAEARGVRRLPAVAVGGRVFHGDEGVEAAAAALDEAAPPEGDPAPDVM